MLKIKNLQKTFNAGTVNEKIALDGLDLHIREGDFVTVIGSNGAGKSTLLNAIAGVWKPDYGTIEIDGVDVTDMPEHKRAPGGFPVPLLRPATWQYLQRSAAAASIRLPAPGDAYGNSGKPAYSLKARHQTPLRERRKAYRPKRIQRDAEDS